MPGPVIHDCVAIIANAVFRGHLVVGAPTCRKNRAYLDLLLTARPPTIAPPTPPTTVPNRCPRGDCRASVTPATAVPNPLRDQGRLSRLPPIPGTPPESARSRRPPRASTSQCSEDPPPGRDSRARTTTPLHWRPASVRVRASRGLPATGAILRRSS